MKHPDKTALRKTLRARRRALGGFHRHMALLRIEARLERLTRRLGLHAVAAFCAFDGEPQLDGWLRRHRGQVWLPRILPDNQLAFHHADPLTACSHRRMPRARTNQFGIIESDDPRRRGINSLDALLIPLVGFDARGNRLGMGAGFYDRALARRRGRRPLAIGVAFGCQEVRSLPVDPWDQPLDYIVTDRALVTVRRSPTDTPTSN
ncbi:MAG: 5-formyltetrahydrofolate cyclo-ligase [Guyparkeria sp.]|uniref:5-formyltetrahydrofolate cyclo-ligase n=1 Tax=Guyparkeria sp. TaxID=2035736 RepID=UPI00397AEF24